ncbi:hypothetical protein T10_10594 [Trichinella papuae]|uniref:Uncharacterized protein n=1 Tax=Trichinella papuae TaxID=268474 RepID=A0A0V1MM12_9BILA|nr:hypothetical protein T10_10594 [Trichinella papuae]
MAYKTTDAMRRSYMCKEERRSIYDRRMTRNLRQWKRKAKWNKFSATKYFLCTSFQASGIGLNAFVVLRLYFLDVMDMYHNPEVWQCMTSEFRRVYALRCVSDAISACGFGDLR